jgi:tRNA (guanosine-2'-O-)-methyltransferase
MKKEEQDRLIQYLSRFATENRLNLIERNLSNRTRYLTVVLEDFFQTQNASAVLRTCDCFGIQDVHVIENRNRFLVNRDIALGATQWLNLRKYNGKADNTPDALHHLKQQGYRIIATSPYVNDSELGSLNLNHGKAALVFGTERTGISKAVEQMADEFVKVPMYGFSDSLNVSVSAAIILSRLVEKLREGDVGWRLSDEEKSDLRLKWLKNSLKRVDLLIERFELENRGKAVAVDYNLLSD